MPNHRRRINSCIVFQLDLETLHLTSLHPEYDNDAADAAATSVNDKKEPLDHNAPHRNESANSEVNLLSHHYATVECALHISGSIIKCGSIACYSHTPLSVSKQISIRISWDALDFTNHLYIFCSHIDFFLVVNFA
jgi:hypothetical protein